MSLVGFCKKVTEKLVSDYNSITKRKELCERRTVTLRVERINMVDTFHEGIVYIFLCEVEVVLSTVKMFCVEDTLFVMPQHDNVGVCIRFH